MLILAAAADLGLAALLVGVSGFIFGGGPEGMNGETGAAIAWTAAFVATLLAPLLGFFLLRRRHPGLGVLVASLPPIGAVFLAFLPLHPY
ncbi:MAG: hypothetical protein JSR90_16870 [Proteobacteria bacterium]|nr:hypothetical protein [Pseudomonadota bacterium]